MALGDPTKNSIRSPFACWMSGRALAWFIPKIRLLFFWCISLKAIQFYSVVLYSPMIAKGLRHVQQWTRFEYRSNLFHSQSILTIKYGFIRLDNWPSVRGFICDLLATNGKYFYAITHVKEAQWLCAWSECQYSTLPHWNPNSVHEYVLLAFLAASARNDGMSTRAIRNYIWTCAVHISFFHFPLEGLRMPQCTLRMLPLFPPASSPFLDPSVQNGVVNVGVDFIGVVKRACSDWRDSERPRLSWWLPQNVDRVRPSLTIGYIKSRICLM